MTKFIEASGKTEELAISSALARLGLERDDVSVEILERPKAGVFGIGAKPARVKVSYEAPDEPAIERAETAPRPDGKPAPKKPETREERPARREKREEPKKPAPQAIEEEAAPVKETPQPTAPVEAAKPEAPTPKPAPQPIPVDEVAPAEKGEKGDVQAEIERFLTGLLAQMEVEASLRIQPKQDGSIQVFLEGEHLGALIGHRGETLDAIQQLCSYSVNRTRSKRVRIHIDVENYRAKREESLRRLANKVAAKVVKYRRNITLEPMNAYERHVIHEALQDFPDVLTYSTGTEPNRRTVVAYSKGKHSY